MVTVIRVGVLILITKRDQDIINFIEYFHIATTKQIYRLFFKDVDKRNCSQRLSELLKWKYIKQTVSTIDNCNAYYISQRPSQLHHDLIRTELYSHIKNKYNLIQWENEKTIDNIRPDALCFINDHDIIFPLFIEVHLSNKFNFNKYLYLTKNNDLKAVFGLMPKVLLITDRQVTVPKGIGIKFKIVDLDMNGLESLFK
jgi:hypothetical protein